MLAVVGIIMGLLDALNGPFFARMADAGWVNRLRWFPAASWGRRAPLILIGTPIMFLGPTLMWLAPSRDKGVLTGWFTMCYFLVVNGVTVTLQSYLASIQELFRDAEARALAIQRQTIFLVITYILAGGAPFLIAFTVNPDTGDQCCVSERYDCTARAPCGCWAPELANATLTGIPLGGTLPIYKPEYESVCGASDGSIAIAAAAAERADACAVPPIPRGRFGAVAALTFALGLLTYLAVPPTRATPVTLSEDSKPPPPLLESMARTFRRFGFVCYAAHMLLTVFWSSFVLANVAIFLVYVVRMEPADIGLNSVILIIVLVVARVTAIPIFARVLVRWPVLCHPARLCGLLRIVEAALTPAVFALLLQPDVAITPVLVVTGILIGVLSAPNDMVSHMLIGWVIDEDALEHGGVRREGMFYACNGLTQHISQALIASVIGIWAAAGFSADLCPADQPPSAISAIAWSFMGGLPLTSVLDAIALLLYPIKGARLARLKQQRELLCDSVEGVAPTVVGRPPAAASSTASGGRGQRSAAA